MDIALIIGVVLGMVFMIGSIAYALFVEGAAGGFGNFVSIPSFGIVFGGMLASVMVAFPMYHVAALGKAIGAVLKPADEKMGPLVDEACEVAEHARKGPADLEKSVDTIRTYFFKDGVQLVVDGMGADEVVEIMETRIEFREKREKLQTDMLKAMGDLSIAPGVIISANGGDGRTNGSDQNYGAGGSGGALKLSGKNIYNDGLLRVLGGNRGAGSGRIVMAAQNIIEIKGRILDVGFPTRPVKYGQPLDID